MPPTSLPHWEHGYRCHGLWLGTIRLGFVSIGPRGLWDGKTWGWEADGLGKKGEETSLAKAKRAVEKAWIDYQPPKVMHDKTEFSEDHAMKLAHEALSRREQYAKARA